MKEQGVATSGELLELKEEILSRWKRLPGEHQATMLLVLLERSEWGDWALEARALLGRSSGDDARVHQR